MYVSPVSPWEVTIKQSMGKLPEPIDVAEEIRDSGSHELPITFCHAIAAGRLPPIHRDPFDRMFVAQAQCEGLTLAEHNYFDHCRRARTPAAVDRHRVTAQGQRLLRRASGTYGGRSGWCSLRQQAASPTAANRPFGRSV
jgi:hypothetical protein